MYEVLFAIAMSLSGLSAVEPPKYQLFTHEEYCVEVARRPDCPESPVGIFSTAAPNVIWIRVDVDPSTALGQSYFIHEMVHYLQHVNGLTGAEDCKARLKLELEAMNVQQAYLDIMEPDAHDLTAMKLAYVQECAESI